MDLLFGTLRVAGLELLLFSFLFSIVILGFAMAFYMAFGLEVYGYRSVSSSLISLFQVRDLPTSPHISPSHGLP